MDAQRLRNMDYSGNAPDDPGQRRPIQPEERPYEQAQDNALPYHRDQTQPDTDTRTRRLAVGQHSVDEVNGDYEVMTDHPAFENLLDAMSDIMAHDRLYDNMEEWGRQQIEGRDTGMEEGDVPFTPFHRAYFSYQQGNGYNQNIRYWESDNNITGPYIPYYSVNHAGVAEGFNEFHGSSADTREQMEELGFDEEVIDSLYDRAEERSYDVADGMTYNSMDYLYWRHENGREPTEHPDTEFMLRELLDQERLVEDEDADFDAPTALDFSPGEDEGELHRQIFTPTQDELLYGYTTNLAEMERYGEEQEALVETFNTAREEFHQVFGIPVGEREENEPEAFEPEEEEAENVSPEDDIIQLPELPASISRESVANAIRTGVDVIEPTGATRRQMNLRM